MLVSPESVHEKYEDKGNQEEIIQHLENELKRKSDEFQEFLSTFLIVLHFLVPEFIPYSHRCHHCEVVYNVTSGFLDFLMV